MKKRAHFAFIRQTEEAFTICETDSVQLKFTVCKTDSVQLKSIKELVGKNLAIRYTQQNIVYFLEEASALDPRTKHDDKCTIIVAMYKNNNNNNITVKQEPGVVSAQPVLPNLKMEVDSTQCSEDAPKDEDIATCEVRPYLLISMID